MPVITLKDGSQGYKYPTKPHAYQPTQTPFCGKAVQLDPKDDYRFVVIREAVGTYCGRPDKKGGGYYWVAPVLPDGTIGAMTTRYIYAESLKG